MDRPYACPRVGSRRGGAAHARRLRAADRRALRPPHRRSRGPRARAPRGAWSRPGYEQREAFALHFRGPADPPLPQATYRLAHDGLGDLEIFIVPVGRRPRPAATTRRSSPDAAAFHPQVDALLGDRAEAEPPYRRMRAGSGARRGSRAACRAASASAISAREQPAAGPAPRNSGSSVMSTIRISRAQRATSRRPAGAPSTRTTSALMPGVVLRRSARSARRTGARRTRPSARRSTATRGELLRAGAGVDAQQERLVGRRDRAQDGAH